jgi:predicted nucleotidyltransferase
LARWQPVGIIAAGTIIRGNPSPSSDLDLYVLHRAPERQRVQRIFGGVPAEIFVNPPERAERYFASERHDGRLITAHMLASGFVVYDADPAVEALRARATQVLESRPEPSPGELVRRRYAVATGLEDAEDVAAVDADLCAALLCKVVEGAVQYRFWDARRWQPRAKDTLSALEALDADLAALVSAFYRTAHPTDRLRLGREIVSRTVGATGFFEWESPVERLGA